MLQPTKHVCRIGPISGISDKICSYLYKPLKKCVFVFLVVIVTDQDTKYGLNML